MTDDGNHLGKGAGVLRVRPVSQFVPLERLSILCGTICT